MIYLILYSACVYIVRIQKTAGKTQMYIRWLAWLVVVVRRPFAIHRCLLFFLSTGELFSSGIADRITQIWSFGHAATECE